MHIKKHEKNKRVPSGEEKDKAHESEDGVLKFIP